MPYSFLTFGQSKQSLSQRLYDSSMQFFADAELGAYVKEALQTFNARANFYRAEFVTPLAAATTWYDLTSAAGSIRPMSATDQDILSLIEYHLLEPQTSSYPLAWTGSAQFTVADILNAIQQVRDQLLSDTGCTVTQSFIAANPGRTFLADTAISLRRVAWIPTTGFGYSPNLLMPSDVWADQSFTAGFPQYPPGYPLTYRRSNEPPLSFDVDIQPAVPGQYDIMTINAGLALSTTAASVLPVPNDWCHVIKWGALAQLFGRESASSDPLRAQYCLMRYKEGIAAMRAAPALLAARINDVPVSVTGLADADFYSANWQGVTPAAPTDVFYSGLNLIAASPIPDGLYSLTASVIQNMPLPTADGDFLQIGRDDVSAVLDEAQHIAMLKCGGAEFTETFPLHLSFMRHCAIYNSKLAALSSYLEFIDGLSQFDQRSNPMFSGSAQGGDNG